MHRLFTSLLVAFAALNATPLCAAPSDTAPSEAVASPVTTIHREQLNGHVVTYAATVGEDVLKDDKGNPAATIFSISYVRQGAEAPAKRPVIFLFNGGPGASSDPLHMAFGPLTVSQSMDVGAASTGAPRKLIANAYSLLDTADLVFIDPVGTGFSRLLPGGDGSRYWNVHGDARAVLGFIRDWLAKNGRAASPKFLCGESYGGFRLATMLGDAGDLKFDGAIFVSPALDMTATSDAPGNDMPYILSLPTMAVDAWYHNRIDRDGRTLDNVFASALQFAETDYAAALLKGSALPDADRQRIAEEVAARIGLSKQFVLDRNLRISVQDFVTGLLADKGLRLGRTDGRYTGVAAELAKKSPPYDDPAIAPGGSVAGLLTDYLEKDLKFPSTRPYITLAMTVNMKWGWTSGGRGPEAYINATPDVAKAMHENADLRIMTAGAYFDLATPLAATLYALDHAKLPKNHVVEKFYESGHSMYQHGPSHAKLAADVRAFVSNTSTIAARRQ